MYTDIIMTISIVLIVLQVLMIFTFFHMANDVNAIKKELIGKKKKIKEPSLDSLVEENKADMKVFKSDEEYVQFANKNNKRHTKKVKRTKDTAVMQELTAEEQREVAPERWEEYCAICEEVDARAEELARKSYGVKEGEYIMGMCHEVWSYKKQILREEYNIEWKSPKDLNPEVMFD